MTGKRENLAHLAAERPAFPLRAPAIVRHLVYRLPSKENPRMAKDPATAWAGFCEQLTTFVNEARSAFGFMQKVRLVRDLEEPDDHSIRSTVLLMLTPQPTPDQPRRWETGMPQCRVRVRIDVHTELYTVTITADSFDLNHDHHVNKTLSRLVDGDDVLSDLHHKLWEEWDTPFLRAANRLEHIQRGSLVADFRGVILYAPPKAAPRPVASPHSDDSKPLDASIAAFLSDRRNTIDSFLRDGAKPLGSEEETSDGIVCSLLDGQMMYAAPLVQWGAKAQSVRYLLVASPQVGADQLGRLVRRLHVVGELRHLALLDFDNERGGVDLKAANGVLREISRKLDRQIEAGDYNPKILMEINQELTQLNSYADGGLVYRIEQSRYYAEAFRSRVVDLRVGRIEGYQPYDAFVRRFIFQIFLKIEQIGRQYNAVGRRIDRWTFLSEARSSYNFHKAIRKTTTALGDVAGKMKGLDESTVRLQQNAENFAAVFLVYYVGHILKEFLVHGVLENAHIEEQYNYAWAAVAVVVILDVAGNDARIVKAAYKVVKFVGRGLFNWLPWAIVKGVTWLRRKAAGLPVKEPGSAE